MSLWLTGQSMSYRQWSNRSSGRLWQRVTAVRLQRIRLSEFSNSSGEVPVLDEAKLLTVVGGAGPDVLNAEYRPRVEFVAHC